MIKLIITSIIIIIIFIIILLSFSVKIEYFNNIFINKIYTVITDTYGNIINPEYWYKFDSAGTGLTSNFGSVGSVGNATNTNTTFNSSDFVKGSGSVSLATNQRLQISNINFNSKSFSISFWVKRFANNKDEFYFQIGDNFGIPYQILLFGHRFGNFIGSDRWGIGGFSSDTYLDANIWIHFVNTFNQDLKRDRTYKNGVLIAETTANRGNLNATTNFYIGNTYDVKYISALIDDFRIYMNLELTEDQVFQLYAGYKKVGQDIDTSINCMPNMNSSGIIKQVPDTNFEITNISDINRLNDYIFNQSFNNAGITYTLTFSRYLDNDYSPVNLLLRNNKSSIFYDSINRDNYDQNGNYIGIFSKNINIQPPILSNYTQKGDFIHIRLTSSNSTYPIKLKRYGFKADPQRPSRAPGTWALYAGTRLLEPSTTNPTLLVNNTTRLNNNSYCSANMHTYFHDIGANETSANELLFIFTSLADFGNNNNSDGVLSFMNLLLFTS